MTVENNTNKVREDGNGSKTAFTFSFEVFDESELEVYKVVKATGVATLQTITTDYTVALNTSGAGGTVTYVVAPTALQESFIKRVVPLVQETDIPNVGGIREEQIENQLDRGVMIDQQLQEQIDRCPKLPDASTLSELELPTPEASKYLGWNVAADALENKDAPTAVDYLGDIDFGNDADKAVSPAQGDVYFAVDTGKMYICLGGGSWTWYNPTTMTTRGDIEFYGASGKERLAAGASGYVLKSQGAGADPAWSPDFTPSASNALTKSLIYRSRYETSSYIDCANATPAAMDNSKPTSTEGDQVMSTTYTPQLSTSLIRITVIVNGQFDGTSVGFFWLLLDSDTEARAVGITCTVPTVTGSTGILVYEYSPASASQITIKVRAGQPSTGYHFYFNGKSGAQVFNGALISSITVEEFKA